MGNRPHPYRRQDAEAMARDPEFQRECDEAYREGIALEAAEREARIHEYETSPEQRDWESDEDPCDD